MSEVQQHTELSIIASDNVKAIVLQAPNVYAENITSKDNCIGAGSKLLARINAEGMTDELDQLAASYIVKSRKTVTKMNEKRSPLTKLFDQMRAQFTALENTIDPSKAGTVAYQLQLKRNEFARKKLAEEEARKREEQAKLQAEQIRNNYSEACKAAYNELFYILLAEEQEKIATLFSNVTLHNYEQSLKYLQDLQCDNFEYVMASRGYKAQAPAVPEGIAPAEASQIRNYAVATQKSLLAERFKKEMQAAKQKYIDFMPAKKAELEKAAAEGNNGVTNIDNAVKQEIETECKQNEQAQAAADKAKAVQSEMGNLFDQQAAATTATPAAYTPKSSVKKKIVPLNAEAFPEIFALWWGAEGCKMSVEDLSKMFKKQITFCEKLANKEGTMITSENIEYQDDVTAK